MVNYYLAKLFQHAGIRHRENNKDTYLEYFLDGGRKFSEQAQEHKDVCVTILGENTTGCSNERKHDRKSYLNDSIKMKTHDNFWNITHEIVKPIIQPSQHINRFLHVSENP